MKKGKKTDKLTEKGVTLTVQADDGDDLPMILEIVSKKISEGYTSGYEPTWEIKGGSE